MTNKKEGLPPEGQPLDNHSINQAAIVVREISAKLNAGDLIEITSVLPELQDALSKALAEDEPGQRALTFRENIDPEILAVAFDDEKDSSDDTSGSTPAQANPGKAQLFVEELIGEGLELIRNAQKTPYARYKGEIYELNTQAGMDLITTLALEKNQGVSAGFLSSVVNTLSAMARLQTPEANEVYKRFAPAPDGGIYIDIGDETNDVIHITASSTTIEPRSDDVFINRPSISMPMARPVYDPGLKVDDLHEFFNMKNGLDLRLVLSWAVAAMYPKGPYPVLSLIGQAGSAKSEMLKKINRLIDPSNPEVRTEPKDEWSLIVGTRNKSLLGIDNMSKISDTMSDQLCVMSTGGGVAVRALYTTGDEFYFDAQIPVAMTSIGAITERPDLLSRSLQIYVPRLEPSAYKTEEELDTRFAELQPGITALLCRALQQMLRDFDSVDTKGFENRMMDFTKRIGAMAPALDWTADEAMQAYRDNVDSADDLILENHPLSAPFIKYLDTFPDDICEASMTEHKDGVERSVNYATHLVGHPDWPRGVRQFNTAIAYLMPSITRVHGWVWEHGNHLRTNKTRLHRFYKPSDFEPSDASDTGDGFAQRIERGSINA